MNSKYLILIIGVLFLYGSNGGFSVKGKILNMPVQQFKVEELGVEQSRMIDSGTTDKDGNFSFSSLIEEESLFRIKFEKGKYILLALKNGDHAEIEGDWNQLENYTVKGSVGSIILKSFLVNLRENINDIQTMQVVLDSINVRPNNDSLKQAALQDLKNINLQFVEYVKKFSDTTQSVANALFAVNIINPAYELPFITDFYQNITKRFPNSKNAKMFADKFLNNIKTLETANPHKGEPAPDFSGVTPEGKTITLSNFKGKYVLLDFWASWCAPCRDASPQVVNAYNTFKNKNIEWISISLDSNKDKWIEAIQKDQLKWTHISDLNGWASAIARNYDVKAIPCYYIIDPQGNIVTVENTIEDAVKHLSVLLK